MQVVDGRLEWRFNKKGYDTYKKAEDVLLAWCPDDDWRLEQYAIVYFKDYGERPRYYNRKTYIVGLYFLRDCIWQCIFNQRNLLGPVTDKLEITKETLENECKQDRNSIH